MGIKVEGPGFGVEGLGLKVWGLGLRTVGGFAASLSLSLSLSPSLTLSLSFSLSLSLSLSLFSLALPLPLSQPLTVGGFAADEFGFRDSLLDLGPVPVCLHLHSRAWVKRLGSGVSM